MTSTIKYFIRRSCTYKTKHKSLYDALQSLLKNRENGIDVDSCYECPVCNHYHIGHYGKATQRKKNRRKIRKYLLNTHPWLKYIQKERI